MLNKIKSLALSEKRKKIFEHYQKKLKKKFSASLVKESSCLLLTAAIEIKDKKQVRRNDTAMRLNDYKETLLKWLTKQKTVSRVVFVDNSGFPLDELKKLAEENNPFGKEVEFLSFIYQGPTNLDKSYYELMTVRYALDHSELLKKAKYFLEVSGRGFIANIDKIMNGLPDDFHVVATFENNNAYIATNILIFKKDFFEKMIFAYAIKILQDKGSRDYMYLERAYARAILLAIEKNYRWYPFCAEPVVIGMSGTKNKSYTQSWFYYKKATLLNRQVNKIQRSSHGRNCEHILDLWQQPPRD